MFQFFYLLIFLELSHVFHFHSTRKGTFVNAVHSAPRASPCKVEYHIEWFIVGPVALAGSVVLVIEQFFTIYIRLYIFRCPFHSINMEIVFSPCKITFLGNLSVVGMIMSEGMKTRRDIVGIGAHLFHNVHFAIVGPCREFHWHHPEGRPSALALRQLYLCLDISVCPTSAHIAI